MSYQTLQLMPSLPVLFMMNPSSIFVASQCTPVIPLAPATSALSVPPTPPTDDCGDLLIHGLWSSATDCILYVCITVTDAKTYQSKGFYYEGVGLS